MSVILMIFIDMNNRLGLMAGYIVNSFCMAPCSENIWSFFGADFGSRCGALVVLKRALCVLNTE